MGKRIHSRHRSIQGEIAAERSLMNGEIIVAIAGLDLVRGDNGSARDTLRSRAEAAIRMNSGMPFSPEFQREMGEQIIKPIVVVAFDDETI